MTEDLKVPNTIAQLKVLTSQLEKAGMRLNRKEEEKIMEEIKVFFSKNRKQLRLEHSSLSEEERVLLTGGGK